jgi:selenocysteine lyase/cysteine desulfurase
MINNDKNRQTTLQLGQINARTAAGNQSLQRQLSTMQNNTTLQLAQMDSELADKLFDDYNIFTVPIDDDRGIRGVRVSPNLYSTVEDIDKFIEAMLRIAA